MTMQMGVRKSIGVHWGTWLMSDEACESRIECMLSEVVLIGAYRRQPTAYRLRNCQEEAPLPGERLYRHAGRTDDRHRSLESREMGPASYMYPYNTPYALYPSVVPPPISRSSRCAGSGKLCQT